MKNTFKDINNYNKFCEEGYVKIQNIIQAEDIKKLKDYFYLQFGQNVKNSLYGMFVSLDEKDRLKSKKAMELIQELITPKLENHLQNYKIHLGSYLVKTPNPYSFTYPHQDWLFVDNSNKEDFSCTIWISLEDIDKDSGTLGFIKGSHIFLDNIVGSPSPEIKTATMGHEKLLLSYMKIENVNAGDALLFNNKTIHAAFPNISKKDRIAVGIGITPIDSEIYHYFLKPKTKNKILKLKANEMFFRTYNNDSLRTLYRKNRIPNFAEIKEEIEYNPTIVSSIELEEMLIKNGNKKNNYDTSMLFKQFENLGFLEKIKLGLKYYFNISL